MDKHKAKEERWEAAQLEMNHRITQQQKDEKVKLEQLRTEAIFNVCLSIIQLSDHVLLEDLTAEAEAAMQAHN